ncbi:hypothetical protein JCM10512_548 [Bacteroides reticulotermitis JCM 10512]|uniref:Uncharacterized protein n=1 Tax=Bacteroides reticulotermitis JCM 10512 TaxID=1445607 RepID=W4UN15_9BACE|nr:hypothetical protein JCM10512_548 [Bacteroides reticulotermitis JCM 10512]
MKKYIFIIFSLLGPLSFSVWAQKQEKTIVVEVNNNWNREKIDEPVVIDVQSLNTGFKIKSAVVMEGSKEVPSQLDDMNRDRRMDELAFVADFKAREKKTFKITLSSEKSNKTYPERICRDDVSRPTQRKPSACTITYRTRHEQCLQYGTSTRTGTGIGVGSLSSLLQRETNAGYLRQVQ